MFCSLSTHPVILLACNQWISSSSLSVINVRWCQVVRSFGACIIETISRAHHPLTRKCLLVSVEATYIYSKSTTCPIDIRDSRAVDRTNSEWRHVVTSMCVTVQGMHEFILQDLPYSLDSSQARTCLCVCQYIDKQVRRGVLSVDRLFWTNVDARSGSCVLQR